MPRSLKEIKAFQSGTIHNASERDISDDTASFSLNIDPMSENGTLDGIKNDKLIASTDNKLTNCLYPVNWGSTNQHKASGNYNTASVILPDISIFDLGYETADLAFIGTKGRKEKLKVLRVSPWWERVIISTSSNASFTPTSAVTATQDTIPYLTQTNAIGGNAAAGNTTISGFTDGTATIQVDTDDPSTLASKTIIITTPDNTTKTFTFYNDSSGASGTLDSAVVRIQLNGLSSDDDFAAQIETAIEHANGFAGKITVTTAADICTLTYIQKGLNEYVDEGDFLALTASTLDASADEFMKVTSIDEENKLIYVKRNVFGSAIKSYTTSTSYQLWSNRLTVDGRQSRTQRAIAILYNWSDYSGNNIGGNGNWINKAGVASDKEDLGVIDTSATAQTITFSNSAKTVSFNNLGPNTLAFNEGDIVNFYYGADGEDEPNNGKSFKILKSERTDSNTDWTWTLDTAPADDTETADTVYIEANLIKNHTFHHASDEVNPTVNVGSGLSYVVNNWVSKRYRYADAAGETPASLDNVYTTAGTSLITRVNTGGYWEDTTADHGADNAASYYPFSADDAYIRIEAEYKDTTLNLSAAVTVDDNFIPAGDLSKIAVNDILKVNSEYMKVLSMTNNKIFVERGFLGSTIAAHSASDDVHKSINPLISQSISKANLKSGQFYNLTFHAKDLYNGSVVGHGAVSVQINGGHIDKNGNWKAGSTDSNLGYAGFPQNVMQENRWINFKDIEKPNGDTAFNADDTESDSGLDTTWRMFQLPIILPKNLDLNTDLTIEFTSRGADGTQIGIDLTDLSEVNYISVVNNSSKVESMGVIDNSGNKELVLFDNKEKRLKTIKNYNQNNALPFSIEDDIEKSVYASSDIVSRDGKASFVSRNREVHVGFGSGSDDTSPQWLGYLNHKTFGIKNDNVLYQDEDTVHTYDSVGLTSMSKLALAGEHENLDVASWSASNLTINHTRHNMVVGNNIVVREWLDTDNSWDGNGVWVVTSTSTNSFACQRIDALDADPGGSGLPAGSKISYRPYYYYGIRDGDSHLYRIIPDNVYTDSSTASTVYVRGKIEKSLPLAYVPTSIATCYNKDMTDGIGGGRVYVLNTAGEIRVVNIELAYNKWNKEVLTEISTITPEYKSYKWSNDNVNGNIGGDTAVYESLASESTPTIAPKGIVSDIIETKGTTKYFDYDNTGQQGLNDSGNPTFDTRLWIQFRPASDETFTSGDRFLFCGLTNSTNTDTSSVVNFGDRTPPTGVTFPKRTRWIKNSNENDHMFHCGPGLWTTGGDYHSGHDTGDFDLTLLPKHSLYSGVRHGGSHSLGYKREKFYAYNIRHTEDDYVNEVDIDGEVVTADGLSYNKIAPDYDFGSNVSWEGDGGNLASIRVAKYGLVGMADNNCDGVIDGTGLVTCTNQSLTGTVTHTGDASAQNVGPYGYEHEQVCSHAVGLIGGSDIPWVKDWGCVTGRASSYFKGVPGRAPENMKSDKVLFICSDVHFGDKKMASLSSGIIPVDNTYLTAHELVSGTSDSGTKVELTSTKGLKPGDLVYIGNLGTGTITQILDDDEIIVTTTYDSTYDNAAADVYPFTFAKYEVNGATNVRSGIKHQHYHFAFNPEDPLDGEIFTNGEEGGGHYSKTWWSLHDAAYRTLSTSANSMSAIKHRVERLNYRAGYMIRPFDLAENTFEDLIIGRGTYIDSPIRPNPIYHVENGIATHNNQGGNVNNQFASKIFITCPIEETQDESNKSRLYICDPTLEYPDILSQEVKNSYKRGSSATMTTNEFNEQYTSYEPILSGKIAGYITTQATTTNVHKNAANCPVIQIASSECELHGKNKFIEMGGVENGFSGQMITIVDAATGTMQTRQILSSAVTSGSTLFLGVHFPFGHTPADDDFFYIWSHRNACTSPLRLFKEKELDYSFNLDENNTVALKADPTLDAPIYKSTGAIASTSGTGSVVTATTSAIHNLSTNDVIEISNSSSYNDVFKVTVTGPKTFTFSHTGTANETGTWTLVELGNNDSSVSNPVKIDSAQPLILSTFGGLDMRKTRSIVTTDDDIQGSAVAAELAVHSTAHFLQAGDTITIKGNTDAHDGVYAVNDKTTDDFDVLNPSTANDTTDAQPITTNQWENIVMSTSGVGAAAEIRAGFNAWDKGLSQGNALRNDNDTASVGDKYLNSTDAAVKISSPSLGDETNDYFLKNNSYDYKISLMYDGYQEGPLSNSTWSFKDTNKTRKTLNIEISVANYSKRLTAVCLYRRDNTNDFFRLVEQITTASGWNYDGAVNKRTIEDRGSVQASYNARTGRSEVLDTIKLKYGISAEIDGFLFVGDCSHENIDNAENQIFRSKPGQFSIFDYAFDFLQLKSKPTALVNFGGRLYAFDKVNTYRINQRNMSIEDIYEGVGCLSKDSLIVTEYGMFFADKNGAYFHDGNSPKKISGAIEQGGDTDNEWSGTDNIKDISWQSVVGNELSKTPYVSYDSASSSVLFFVSHVDYDSNTSLTKEKEFCWSYNLGKNRWDLWEVAEDASIGVPLIADKGAVLIPVNNALYEFKGGNTKRDYTWLSKKMTMEEDSILKVFNKVKINGIQDDLNLGGSYKESSDRLLVKTSEGDISSSDITYKSKPGNHSEYRLKSTNKKGRWIQFKLEDMTKPVDSIGIIYRRKSTK